MTEASQGDELPNESPSESHGEHLSSESPDADNARHAGEQGGDAEAHGGYGAEDSGPKTDAQARPAALPGSDAAHVRQDAHADGGGSGEVGVGGYGGRDPATSMPRMPTAPETQGDMSDADK